MNDETNKCGNGLAARGWEEKEREAKENMETDSQGRLQRVGMELERVARDQNKWRGLVGQCRGTGGTKFKTYCLLEFSASSFFFFLQPIRLIYQSHLRH